MSGSRINIQLARSGMQLSKPVYDGEQILLLPAQVVLTPKSIMRLKLCGIEEIWIEGEAPNKGLIKEEEPKYIEQLKKSPEFSQFSHAHRHSVDEARKALNGLIINNREIEVNQLIEEVNQMLRGVQTGAQVFDMLQCIKVYDDSTYVHSVNVALICNVMGRWLHLSEAEIEVLTLCGMLHDVGKLMMPPEIIKKAGKLTHTEFDTIKRHPEIGYSIISKVILDDRIKYAILQHHEKCDGSGYPQHLKREEIQAFSKIVTIADVYDAMTANRVYREGLCPFDVIDLFEQEGMQKYETLYLLVFLRRNAESYINKVVRLNNGEEGKIVMINTNALARPVIKAGENYIDLTKDKSLSIQAVL